MTTPGATWQITIVDETGSTNADLAAAAASGAANRSVLMARSSDVGKGTTRPAMGGTARHQPVGVDAVSRRARASSPTDAAGGVGCLAACSKVAGVSPVLKWPNDLLLDERKLAGVLAQAGGPGTEYVVVGIGLNIGWAPEGAARLGDGYDPVDVLDAMLVAYDDLPDDITDIYRTSLVTIGQSVRVELSGSEVVGRALDVLR